MRNRVNLNVPVSADGLRSTPAAAVESTEVRRERELKLQAAIVRTMKARKYMSHQAIIAEAITQCKKWFTPKVAVIKKSLEALLEQEYISRDDKEGENGETTHGYSYVA